MALACKAEMTARFSARAPREWSRAVVTVEPFLSVVAYAREAHGEFRSDLHVQDSGDTACAEEMRLTSRLPDHRGVDEGSQASMVLNG